MCLTGYTGTGSCDIFVRDENTFHCCTFPRIFLDYRWLMQVCCRLSITLAFLSLLQMQIALVSREEVITKSCK
jgi:hypothetical protein